MPTVVISRKEFYRVLGVEMTDKEFTDLCFEFGIELDDVTTEKEMVMREANAELATAASEEIVYKIDIPANRYDLLCLEGLARALRIFLNLEESKLFKCSPIPEDKMLTMVVDQATSHVRQYVVCAVLRNINFTVLSYNSFLDLQDKLHHNICRKRSLVAIGTHDLDKVKPPFFYKAIAPEDIKFQPLMEDKVFTAGDLMNYYEKVKVNCKLKPYVKLIRDSPVYPVIYDSNCEVLSLPPIINSEYSKISLGTKNVFIECTATDLTKAQIVLNMMTTMFAHYCEPAFSIEPVKVVYHDCTMITPQLNTRVVPVKVDYVNSGLGTKLSGEEMVRLLTKMSMPATLAGNVMEVSVPPTRPDVLHPCDILEDVGIAFGYNNLTLTVPQTFAPAKQLPINKLTDLIRENIAQAGYSEALTWALCSVEENFSKLLHPDDGTAVKISNPKTAEFQLVRTNLISGLLKTLSANQGKLNLPIRIFEAADIALLDNSSDVGSRNERRLACLFCGQNTSGLEEIHGIVDRVMELNRVSYLHEANALRAKDLQARRSDLHDFVYQMVNSDDSTFFQGRRADILLNDVKIGVFGVLHPEVLQKFEIANPCSALEINLEALLPIHLKH